MAFRNWQQELVDRRTPQSARPPVWLIAAGVVLAAGVLACILWGWPGVLREREVSQPPSAEDIYLQQEPQP